MKFKAKSEKKLMKSLNGGLLDKDQAHNFFQSLKSLKKLSPAYLILCSNEGYAKETVKEIALGLLQGAGGAVGGFHHDLILLEPDNEKVAIKIAAIRGILEKISLKPYQSENKIIIIDKAYRMNEEAQNAFLKTLEEPPRDTVIFLISSGIIGFLETVISRCKIIRLRSPRQAENSGLAPDKHKSLIEDFIMIEGHNYLSYFNFEDKNEFQYALKALYFFFRDAAFQKVGLEGKGFLLVEANRDFAAYIKKLSRAKIFGAIAVLEKMSRYSAANTNLRLCQINTAHFIKAIMER